jgi:hypothetical protein
MPAKLKSAAALILGATLAAPATSEVGRHDMFNVSQQLLQVYNAKDAAGLHELLASPLKARYSAEAVRDILTRCRVLTHDIFRLSPPSWGARRFGFFAVYTETSVFEIIREHDEDKKIVHWVVTDNVTSQDQQCSISESP